jgi:Rrf2 family nitric oxide-sensitive transcriptional repressor
MRLTAYTEYSLRMLIYLATKDDGLATIAEVARSYGISEHHLTKVAHQLGRAGYIATYAEEAAVCGWRVRRQSSSWAR